jgi:hypothetical protein
VLWNDCHVKELAKNSDWLGMWKAISQNKAENALLLGWSFCLKLQKVHFFHLFHCFFTFYLFYFFFINQ